MACDPLMPQKNAKQAVTTAQGTSSSGGNSSQTLVNGTYLSVYQFMTSFSPYPLVSIVINGNSFVANYQFSVLMENGQSVNLPLTQTGTYSLNKDGLSLTQQALYLTPGSGQSQYLVAPYFICNGPIFADNTATSVAGLSYEFQDSLGGAENSQSFSANGTVIQPGLILSNEATLSYDMPGAIVAPPSFQSGVVSLMYSLILQTPLPQFQPTAIVPSNNTFAAPQSMNDPEVANATIVAPMNYVALNSIQFSGDSYTTSATLYEELESGQTVALGNIVGSGTYTTAASGFMTLNQKALQLTPASGEASNISCSGVTITSGMASNVAGATCNGQTFQSNGTPFGAGLTVINVTTLSPCSQSFVNCQFDPLASYVSE
jgi:hypothetical protein